MKFAKIFFSFTSKKPKPEISKNIANEISSLIDKMISNSNSLEDLKEVDKLREKLEKINLEQTKIKKNPLYQIKKLDKQLKNPKYDLLKVFDKTPSLEEILTNEENDNNEKEDLKLNNLDKKKKFKKDEIKSIKEEKKNSKKKSKEELFEYLNLSGEKRQAGLDNIPGNLIIKTLTFPKTKSEVLLFGVEKQNESHCSFINDLFNKLKFDNIVTQIPPDLPYFIRTEDNYKIAWKQFINGKFDYKFVINPNPTCLADLVIDQNRLKFLMDGSFIKTPEEFELGSVFLYSKNKKTFKLEVDCFLTSLLFSYNNKDKIIPIILNDFPLLQYRERIVWNIELKDLKELFNSYIESIQEKNIYFDPCLLKPDIFIEPKITYLTEIIKQSCFMGKKIIAIVDINCAELIADIWKSESNLDEIINLQKILKTNNKKKMSMSFSDYIEKHVMLDIMFDNFVQENFIAYKNFPFDAEGTLGKEIHMNNLFMIWNHFHRKYKLKYGDVKHFDEKIDILDNKIQPDDMEPEDFDDKLQK